MSGEATQTAAAGRQVVPTRGEAVVDLHAKALQAAVEIQMHALERASRAGEETLGFMRCRLESDRKVAAQIARLRSPMDALSVWTWFLDTATRDYAQEYRKLAGLQMESARNAADEFQRTVGKLVGGATHLRA